MKNLKLMFVFIVASIVMPLSIFAETKEAEQTKKSSSNQRNREHHIAVHALFDYAIVRDKVVSPLLYHAVRGGLMLGYEYRAAKHEHRVRLQATGGGLTRPGLLDVPGGGSYTDIFLLSVQWALEYSFAITLVRRSNWHLGLGGIADTTADIRTYPHIWAPVVSFSSSWNFSPAFGPLFIAAWQPAPKHNLRFRLAMPIISVVKRPSWNLVNPQIEAQANKSLLAALYEEPRVTSVHEWLRLGFEFAYEWRISQLIQLNAEYHGILLISSLPRFYGTLTNQLSFGLNFRL